MDVNEAFKKISYLVSATAYVHNPVASACDYCAEVQINHFGDCFVIIKHVTKNSVDGKCILTDLYVARSKNVEECIAQVRDALLKRKAQNDKILQNILDKT